MVKITKEQRAEFAKLRKKGMSYNDISLKTGVKLATVLYNTNEHYREYVKNVNRLNQRKTYQINKEKRSQYQADWRRERYHTNPEFREKIKKTNIEYQKKKRMEKDDK